MAVVLTEHAARRADVVVEGRQVVEIVRTGSCLRVFAPGYFGTVDLGLLNKQEARAVALALIEMAGELPDAVRIA